MPVIDHTIVTLEIKKFKEEINQVLEELKKRLEAIEGKKVGK